MKEILPIPMSENSEFECVLKGSARKCYNVLEHLIHCNCRSVLNNMVVTYQVSHTKSK